APSSVLGLSVAPRRLLPPALPGVRPSALLGLLGKRSVRLAATPPRPTVLPRALVLPRPSPTRPIPSILGSAYVLPRPS
ncbi:unnamed protein product, partial [Gulo gulo]